MDFRAAQAAEKLRKLSEACKNKRLDLERARIGENEAEFNLAMAEGGRPAVYYEVVTKRIGD